jgi:hypothetical protein
MRIGIFRKFINVGISKYSEYFRKYESFRQYSKERLFVKVETSGQ